MKKTLKKLSVGLLLTGLLIPLTPTIDASAATKPTTPVVKTNTTTTPKIPIEYSYNTYRSKNISITKTYIGDEQIPNSIDYSQNGFTS